MNLREKREAVVSYNVLSDQIVDLEKQIDNLKRIRDAWVGRLAEAYGEKAEDHTNTHFLDKVVWELGQEQIDNAARSRKGLTVIEKPGV